MDNLPGPGTVQELALIGIDIAYVLLGLAMLLVAKHVNDWLTPFKIDVELSERDNPALGLALSGYFLGVVAIYVGAVIGQDLGEVPSAGDLLGIMAKDAGYALAGILALNLGRVVVDRLILHRFSTAKEIIVDRNVGTGAVEAGALLATGLIVAGAVNGSGGGPLSALVFFVLGQAVLVIYARVYDRMTFYDLHEEIECDNVAAGVAFGASLVAIGIILLKATSGAFVGWTENLSGFVLYTVIGFVALIVLRIVADRLFLPGSSLDHEIAHDANLSAALIEATIAIGAAVMIFAVL